MFNFETYINRLIEDQWFPTLNQYIYMHLIRKGFSSSSDVLYIKALLKTRLEGENGPLNGIEPLMSSCYEMLIIGMVIDQIIDEELLEK